MKEFDPHVAYINEKESAPLDTAVDRERNAEFMLQLKWFTHRCQGINNEEELEARLRQLAESDPNMAEQIERSTPEEKQTIIMNQMILNPQGFPEASWFRVHFPSDKTLPLEKDYRLILDAFETDPDGACAKLDELFQASITTH